MFELIYADILGPKKVELGLNYGRAVAGVHQGEELHLCFRDEAALGIRDLEVYPELIGHC